MKNWIKYLFNKDKNKSMRNKSILKETLIAAEKQKGKITKNNYISNDDSIFVITDNAYKSAVSNLYILKSKQVFDCDNGKRLAFVFTELIKHAKQNIYIYKRGLNMFDEYDMKSELFIELFNYLNARNGKLSIVFDEDNTSSNFTHIIKQLEQAYPNQVEIRYSSDAFKNSIMPDLHFIVTDDDAMILNKLPEEDENIIAFNQPELTHTLTVLFKLSFPKAIQVFHK
jgi:NhaP-type Na+/H+ and K+/H+ antiporter